MFGKNQIYQLLTEQGIPYEAVEHKAVFTVAEAEALRLPHPEAGAKNLFLRDDKKRNYYLLTVRDQLSVDLKRLHRQLGTRRLSFASAEDLWEKLGLVPGAVTPFGVLNDREHTVRVFLDAYFAHRLIAVHPNDNTATVYLDGGALAALLREHGNEVEFVALGEEERNL